jgi:hypothetical protein
MSFAWGQSLPSNHYRTSEYRRSLSAETQTFEAPADRQLRKAILDQVDDAIIPSIRKQVADGSTSAALKQLDGLDDKQIRKLFEDLVDSDNFDKVDKGWLKKMIKGEALGGGDIERLARSITSDSLQKTLTQESLKSAADGAADAIDNAADFSPRQKTLMRYGLAGTTVIGTAAVFMGLGGNEAIQKFIDSQTGRDCDIKALDKGLTEGTPEYEAAVGTCQEGSLKTLRNMGYAIIAVGGLLGFIAITRLIPKAEGE